MGRAVVGGAFEVYHTRNVDATGPVDLMLDVHGDEAEPYCFIIGGENTPGWDERRRVQRDFKEAYARACPDFQTTSLRIRLGTIR